jgi:hypothetical protein
MPYLQVPSTEKSKADEKGVEAGVAAGMNGTSPSILQDWASRWSWWIVIWIPDEGLRTVYPNQEFGASQVLTSLEEFKSEEWGLPKIEVRST